MEVQDKTEIKELLAVHGLFDPERVEAEVVPEMQKIVDESNGRLTGFYIWPHYRANGLNEMYKNGRRYPKRL